MKTMEPKSGEKKKKVAFGAAGVSLFIHLGLFLLIGGVVVVEYAVPRSPMTGEVTPVVSSEETATPDETPESMGEPESMADPTESTPASAPLSPVDMSVSSVDVLTVNSPVTSFQMPAPAGGLGGTGTSATGEGTGTGGKGGRGKVSNPFGGADRLGDSSWEGVLYDLKQTKGGKPNGMNAAKYGGVIRDFFAANWSMRVLDDYYKVQKPLFTSQIYMPLMSAGAAPKAFSVENEVQPAQWVVIYNGSFKAPKSGQFRFAGYADDVMGVRIDGKNVLDASRASMGTPKGKATAVMNFSDQEFVPSHKIGNGVMAYSDWQRYTEGDNHKIQILVGEQPGGQFCAYLFVEERNEKYEKDASGRPILPIFRTADMDTPSSPTAVFAPEGPIFGAK